MLRLCWLQNRGKIVETKLIQKNKKAYFNYEILEELETGIALVGTEVKSVREGKCSFSDSYIVPKNGSLILIGFLIQPYSHGNIFNHKTDRNRVLLAHNAERMSGTRRTQSGRGISTGMQEGSLGRSTATELQWRSVRRG